MSTTAPNCEPGDEHHDGAADGISAAIVCQFDAWRQIGAVEDCIQRAIAMLRYVPEATEYGQSEITIALCDDAMVRTLNRQFRNQDKPTNVLSFPATANSTHHADAADRSLGDIILAYETVMSEASGLKKPAADHLTHLVIHGSLHLLGYDHETECEAELMENMEVSLLKRLDIANPYSEARDAQRAVR